ncbi:MAG: PAS domain S-box protein [Vicinamibacterales bacterium]
MTEAVHDHSTPAAIELRSFIEEAPTAIAMLDDHMHYIVASGRWRQDFGLTNVPIIGRSHYDLFPHLPERWKAVHRRCLAGAIEHCSEDSFQRADGSLQWLRWEVRPWRTVNGSIGGLTLFSEDITERVTARRLNAESEERLKLALESSNAGVWLLDLASNLSISDERTHRILGLPPGPALSLDTAMTVIHADDRGRLQARLDGMRNTPGDDVWDEQFRVTHPDGAVRFLHGRGRADRDAAGLMVRLTGIILDVTARTRDVEAIRRGQERLQLALDAATAGSWTWDIDADTLSGDRRYSTRFGGDAPQVYTRDFVIGRFHKDDRARVRATMDSVTVEGGPTGWDIEYRVPQDDGSMIWLLSIGRLTRGEDGRPLRVDGISLDITARKKAQSEIERSHAALRGYAAELERRAMQLRQLMSDLTLAEQRTREHLAKTLHDDLQQLLFSAMLQLERVSRTASDPMAVNRLRKELEQATEAARSLSVELFPPALRQGGLSDALTWIAEWFHQKYGIDVSVDAHPDANPPEEDVRVLLFESVRELLFNAVKYARAERVTLTSRLDDDGRLQIAVADEGHGFDPAALLQPGRGAGGLGLFGIRERLTYLGGHMDVDSAPGRGATFTLVVPFNSSARAVGRGVVGDGSVDPNATDTTDDGLAAQRPRPLRILLADDHTMVREALRELLTEREEFLIVGEAVDGLDAVEQSRSLVPDVVIMDVSMPRLDGLEATRRIRDEIPSIRIFGLSTQEESSKLHAIETAGADGYFAKGNGVRRMVERLLALHAGVVDEGMKRDE